jgi:Flp pilus assembly protein TadD
MDIRSIAGADVRGTVLLFFAATAISVAGLACGNGSSGPSGSGSERGRSAQSDRFSEEKLERIRRSADERAVQYLLDAEDAYRQGSYVAGLALIDSAAAIEPDLPDIYSVRGNILTELRRVEEAQKSYRRALELAPGYEGARFNLANNELRQGNFREAISLYREALTDRESAQAYTNLGRAYEELGVVDGALWAYEEAIWSDSALAEPYMSVEQILEDEGR